jgi:head-tail adaptor
MGAGARDRRVEILRRQISAGAANEDVETWPAIGVRSAAKRDASGGEKLRLEAVGGQLSSRFRMLRDSLTLTVTVLDRLRCEGRTYDITDTREVAQLGRGARELEFDVVARAEIPATGG